MRRVIDSNEQKQLAAEALRWKVCAWGVIESGQSIERMLQVDLREIADDLNDAESFAELLNRLGIEVYEADEDKPEPRLFAEIRRQSRTDLIERYVSIGIALLAIGCLVAALVSANSR